MSGIGGLGAGSLRPPLPPLLTYDPGATVIPPNRPPLALAQPGFGANTGAMPAGAGGPPVPPGAQGVGYPIEGQGTNVGAGAAEPAAQLPPGVVDVDAVGNYVIQPDPWGAGVYTGEGSSIDLSQAMAGGGVGDSALSGLRPPGAPPPKPPVVNFGPGEQMQVLDGGTFYGYSYETLAAQQAAAAAQDAVQAAANAGADLAPLETVQLGGGVSDTLRGYPEVYAGPDVFGSPATEAAALPLRPPPPSTLATLGTLADAVAAGAGLILLDYGAGAILQMFQGQDVQDPFQALGITSAPPGSVPPRPLTSQMIAATPQSQAPPGLFNPFTGSINVLGGSTGPFRPPRPPQPPTLRPDPYDALYGDLMGAPPFSGGTINDPKPNPNYATAVNGAGGGSSNPNSKN